MFHLSPQTHNAKTGPLATTTSPKSTCPKTCPWMGNGGCYAAFGPIRFHWEKVSAGERGTDFETHLLELKALPRQQFVRLNQAGDLPGNGFKLNKEMTRQILEAASWRRIAWVHTHYNDYESRRWFCTLGTGYATVNISCDSPAHADRLWGKGLPLTCIVPENVKVQKTPKGRRIVLCPAQSIPGVTCFNCGNGHPLCWRKDRSYIIGFYPHGVKRSVMLKEVRNGNCDKPSPA